MDETTGQVAEIVLRDLDALPIGIRLVIILLCVVVVALTWFVLALRKDCKNLQELLSDLQVRSIEALNNLEIAIRYRGGD